VGVFVTKQRSNSDLQAFYEKSYKTGEAEVFTFFENGKHVSEDHPAALAAVDWRGRTVLDIGCGTGMLARAIAERGARRVVALDYSVAAIEEARTLPRLDTIEFVTADIMSWAPTEQFDVVVTLGTMEHLDNPRQFLGRMVDLLTEDGDILVACPHFLNPRGYVWMALATLLDVPISLSDLHFIHPWHMDEWASSLDLSSELITTVDRNWAYGQRLLRDFGKRLPNALRDAGLPTRNVEAYMRYLEDLVRYLELQKAGPGLDGATALYRFRRK
jgi:2-polyprenyl-3-methyl-5-hydroxy-6-metoxy-1,4-benzoquinol methylase